MGKTVRYILFFLFISTGLVNAQDDAYYSSLNTSLSSFVYNLKLRIRSPYTQVSYSNYGPTNVENFASFDNGNGTRTVYCVYSGYAYVYTPPFSWGTMSREHTFCYSWMPNTNTSAENYSDQYHLFPTQQNNANGVRSNHPLGTVTNVTSTFLNCKYGTNASGYLVFEPQDKHKGDAARAMLYMCIKYDSVGGYVWNFNYLNTKLASLSEGPQDLNLLLQWHAQDPPDKWEVSRNNYIQSIQQNRNPLVDHPEYIYYINFSDMSKLNPSYSAEPDNYATGFTASVSGSAVTVTWTDAVLDAQTPSGYLLEAYNTDNYFIPIDGNVYADDTDLTDGKAVVNIDYSAANTYTFSGLGSGTYYFRMYSYNGTGVSRNYKITGTVPNATATVSGALSPEPSNYVTGFTTGTITTNSISVKWTDALPGTQSPSGYLILANNTNTFSDPVDGITYSSDSVLSDGSAAMNVDFSAADSLVFSSLSSNTAYYFRIYSYNGTGTSRNYKTDGTVPNASGTTLTSPVTYGSCVLLDNFNRTAGNTVGNTPTSPTSLTWSEAETVSGTGASIVSNRLQEGSSTAGRDYAIVNMSGIVNYPVKLNTSTYNLQWAFNFRNTRTDPSGFDASNYGIAFILGMSSSDAMTANGYAIVIGQSGAVNPIRLASFTGGLDANANFTDIISSGSYGSEYISVRVLYAPSTNTWTLFAESNSGSFPQSDPRNTATQLGSPTVNSTYTGSTLNYLGCLWNHATGSSEYAVFDDIYITDPGGVLPVKLTSFNSSVSGNNVKLEWKTGTESNNKGFEVYRKNTGSTETEKLGFVSGKNKDNSVYNFDDKRLNTGVYRYFIKQIDFNGNSASFELNGDVNIAAPGKFNLNQNYPNPFNPFTTIEYAVPYESNISLKVYDISGKEIKIIKAGKLKPGYYTEDFDASGLASGVYLYRLAMNSAKGNFVSSKKMVLIK